MTGRISETSILHEFPFWDLVDYTIGSIFMGYFGDTCFF